MVNVPINGDMLRPFPVPRNGHFPAARPAKTKPFPMHMNRDQGRANKDGGNDQSSLDRDLNRLQAWSFSLYRKELCRHRNLGSDDSGEYYLLNEKGLHLRRGTAGRSVGRSAGLWGVEGAEIHSLGVPDGLDDDGDDRTATAATRRRRRRKRKEERKGGNGSSERSMDR